MKTVTFRVFCLALLFPFFAQSQQSLQLGGFVGIANYQGDFSRDPFECTESHLAASLQLRSFLNTKWALRICGSLGKLSGDYQNVDVTNHSNWSFQSKFLEIAFTTEWHPFAKSEHQLHYFNEQQISPYVFGGLGGLITRSTFSGEEIKLKNFPERDDRAFFFSIPVGIGLRLDLSRDWSAGMEIGCRATFSDMLDGLSRFGKPDTNDWYFLAGVSFYYQLSSSPWFVF